MGDTKTGVGIFFPQFLGAAMVKMAHIGIGRLEKPWIESTTNLQNQCVGINRCQQLLDMSTLDVRVAQLFDARGKHAGNGRPHTPIFPAVFALCLATSRPRQHVVLRNQGTTACRRVDALAAAWCAFQPPPRYRKNVPNVRCA